MAGGDTPESAWNQTSKSDSDDVDMAIDDGPTLDGETKMKVISGENGQFTSVPHLNTPEYCIKIGLTLYKVQQNIYLLDFQKMTGDAFSFMTLCANIITELKTLSAASKKQQQLLAQQQAMLSSHQQNALHANASQQM